MRSAHSKLHLLQFTASFILDIFCEHERQEKKISPQYLNVVSLTLRSNNARESTYRLNKMRFM